MGLEHIAAVWEHSRQSGSSLIVLLAVASFSDHNGEWRIDQSTLQRKVRLSRRRVQEILEKLVESGELAVTSHHGRGRLSTYCLQVGEKAQPAAPFSQPQVAAARTFSAEKSAEERTFSTEKGAEERTFPATPSPPSPPDPHIPPYPPDSKKADMESFALALRPLSGPQSATHRANLLLEEAGIPLPSPAQIGLWLRTVGGIEPLLELLRRLIHAGLANKRNPAAYVHRVVMERAKNPEPARTSKPRDARAGRELLWAAGADEDRWEQAQEIIETTEAS